MCQVLLFCSLNLMKSWINCSLYLYWIHLELTKVDMTLNKKRKTFLSEKSNRVASKSLSPLKSLVLWPAVNIGRATFVLWPAVNSGMAKLVLWPAVNTGMAKLNTRLAKLVFWTLDQQSWYCEHQQYTLEGKRSNNKRQRLREKRISPLLIV